MKRCPTCDRTYTDLSLNFCLEDGTPLVADVVAPSDPGATIRYPPPRETADPPPTEIYRPDSPLISQPPPPSQQRPQQWSPTPSGPPPKKSNAIWWILGGLAAVVVIGVGLVVMIIALVNMSSTNENNANGRVANRNTNTNATVNSNANDSNSNSNLRTSFADDFSQQKWGTGDSKFGKIWYSDDEYHMTSKDKTFVVMYAPSDEYNTENATVKVTARSVDGTVPSSGFGLMVHCAQSKAKQLEDYALLIYPNGNDPEYEVVMHQNGNQSSLISRTKSSALRSGTTPNQLEIRIKGTELTFYANGQYLNRITDNANYKRGRAGLYTSGTTEVAFDDLEINR